MWVKLIPVYLNGRRRSASDMRSLPPLSGELTIADAIDPDLPGRPKRIARLRNPRHRGKEPYCGTLYDPEVISMDARGFLLRGFSIVSVQGGPPELHVQGWLVRPGADDGLGER